MFISDGVLLLGTSKMLTKWEERQVGILREMRRSYKEKAPQQHMRLNWRNLYVGNIKILQRELRGHFKVGVK